MDFDEERREEAAKKYCPLCGIEQSHRGRCGACIGEIEDEKPVPIGKCATCGTPYYTKQGFCGVCAEVR